MRNEISDWILQVVMIRDKCDEKNNELMFLKYLDRNMETPFQILETEKDMRT